MLTVKDLFTNMCCMLGSETNTNQLLQTLEMNSNSLLNAINMAYRFEIFL